MSDFQPCLDAVHCSNVLHSPTGPGTAQNVTRCSVPETAMLWATHSADRRSAFCTASGAGAPITTTAGDDSADATASWGACAPEKKPVSAAGRSLGGLWQVASTITGCPGGTFTQTGASEPPVRRLTQSPRSLCDFHSIPQVTFTPAAIWPTAEKAAGMHIWNWNPHCHQA